MNRVGSRVERIASSLSILAMALACPLASEWISGQALGQDNPREQFKPAPNDIIRAKGFPSIGKWMISPRFGYADWFGEKYDGKQLREPINAIIIDPFADSLEEAVGRFLEACAKAGFSSRPGHSGGYFGWLADRLYDQIPAEKHHAIADEPFELHNNHGRFFGPCLWDGRYFLIGSLSREKLVPATKAEHLLVSFNQARDKFARVLAENGSYKLTSFLNLENALLDNPAVCTADHDGVAVVLTAVR